MGKIKIVFKYLNQNNTNFKYYYNSMKDLYTYLVVDEAFISPALLKQIGTKLLPLLKRVLITVGLDLANSKLDEWVDEFVQKYPNHKKEFDILLKILKGNINKIGKDAKDQCDVDDGIDNVIKKVILPYVDNSSDKDKIEAILN